MLNDSTILNLVKRKLRVPFQKLELSDSEVLEHLKDIVLDEFSDYVPYTKYLKLEMNDPAVKISNSQYRIIDPDDDEILWVDEIIRSPQVMGTGHPMFGPFSYQSLPQWYLKVYQSRTAFMTSILQYTFEFEHPNLLRIYGMQSDGIVIYSCKHPSFLTIPSKFSKLVKDMCIAESKMLIGNIRNRFTGLTTPFGEIQLDGEALKTEGKELWDYCMERLKLIPPRLLIDSDVS